MLFAAALFFACNEDDNATETDGDMQTEADRDADTPADGDIDRDNAEPEADGDTDGSVSENDTDTEADGDGDTETDVEPEPDIDGDAEPELEPEVDSDTEPEAEEPNPIITESFPFATTTIVPCSETLNKYQPFGVWGDDLGKVYFAGAADAENGIAPFWVYDENTDTFTCDPNVTETLYAIDGRVVEGEPEVWVLTPDKIGRLQQGGWEFFNIPDAKRLAIEDLTLSGIKISPAGKIAAWNKNWGLAFYDTTAQTWTSQELCSGMDTAMVLNGYWVDEIFYMPGGCNLYAIDPANPACNLLTSISECDNNDGDRLYATGVVDKKIWLVRCVSSYVSWVAKNVLVVDIENSKLISSFELNTEICEDIWAPSGFIISHFMGAISGGTVGTPIILTVTIERSGGAECSADLFLNISQSPTQLSCNLSESIETIDIYEGSMCGLWLHPISIVSQVWRSSEENNSWFVDGNVSKIIRLSWDAAMLK